jgi:hypothetical protein
MILTGKPKDSEKNLSQCHIVHHKSHCIDQGANSGHCGEWPATVCMSHGTDLGKILEFLFSFSVFSPFTHMRR